MKGHRTKAAKANPSSVWSLLLRQFPHFLLLRFCHPLPRGQLGPKPITLEKTEHIWVEQQGLIWLRSFLLGNYPEKPKPKYLKDLEMQRMCQKRYWSLFLLKSIAELILSLCYYWSTDAKLPDHQLATLFLYLHSIKKSQFWAVTSSWEVLIRILIRRLSDDAIWGYSKASQLWCSCKHCNLKSQKKKSHAAPNPKNKPISSCV